MRCRTVDRAVEKGAWTGEKTAQLVGSRWTTRSAAAAPALPPQPVESVRPQIHSRMTSAYPAPTKPLVDTLGTTDHVPRVWKLETLCICGPPGAREGESNSEEPPGSCPGGSVASGLGFWASSGGLLGGSGGAPGLPVALRGTSVRRYVRLCRCVCLYRCVWLCQGCGREGRCRWWCVAGCGCVGAGRAVPRAPLGRALGVWLGGSGVFDAVGQFGDLVVDGAALGHEGADLAVRVHHRRMVPAAELAADLGQ